MKKTIVVTSILAAAFFALPVSAQISFDTNSISQLSGTTASTTAAVTASPTDQQTLVQATDKGSTALLPSPQMAMSSPDYPVTAGDIYTLAFAAGSTPVTYTISVDTSYRIRVANLAVIPVKGLTFLQLKKQVEDIVIKNYPLSGVQFVLMTPAVFKVTVKGEVKQTEIKQAWALTRLSSVIAGSLTDFSSIRLVTVTPSSGTPQTYDLFKAERFGDMSQNPYVRPDDTISVGRFSRRVTVSGAVERPGTYELLDGENLKELIDYYGGGLVDRADTSRMELTRTLNQSAPSGTIEYLKQNAIDSDYVLMCYDSVSIPLYLDLKPVMFMEGALYAASGTTPEGSTRVAKNYTTGENYSSLIRENRTMFSAVSDIANAYIIRNGKNIPLDMRRILYDATYYTDENVEPYDTLMVPFRQYFVTVSGAVETPGRYPYIPDRDWSYYIGLAGGFTADKNVLDAVHITDINGKRHGKSDPITPETNILALSNSFTYYFSKYSSVISVLLTSITTAVTVYVATK